LTSARRDDGARELLAERFHDGQRREDLRALVGVRHAGGRFGVVLDEANDAVLADESVESRRRRCRAEAWVAQGERLFLRVEVERPAKILVGEQRALEAAQRRVDRRRRLLMRGVLPV